MKPRPSLRNCMQKLNFERKDVLRSKDGYITKTN